jgi:hypothetical protein
MEGNAAISEVMDRGCESGAVSSQYYSVEVSFQGLDCPYQFKIWNVAAESMCVLVKEGSEILSRLKVGEILRMKYYSADVISPSESLETAIRHITKDEQGRFKGHYLVGLEILGNPSGQVH